MEHLRRHLTVYYPISAAVHGLERCAASAASSKIVAALLACMSKKKGQESTQGPFT